MSDDSPANAPPEPTDVRFNLRALVIVTVVVALVAAVLGPYFRSFSPDDRPRVAVRWGICLASVAGWLAYYARTRYLLERRAGPVLGSLHKYSRQFSGDNRWAIRLGSGAMFAMGLFYIAVLANHSSIPRNTSQFVFLYLFPALIGGYSIAYGITLIWWHRTVQFREHGALYGIRLLHWDSVTDCHWETPTGSRMKLEGIDQRRRDLQLEMVVPIADREAVRAILDERLAASSSPHRLRLDAAPTVAPQPIAIDSRQVTVRRGCLYSGGVWCAGALFVSYTLNVQAPEFIGGTVAGSVAALVTLWFGQRAIETGPPRVRVPVTWNWPVLLGWVALATTCHWLSLQVPFGYGWINAVLGCGFGFAVLSVIFGIPYFDADFCERGIVVPRLLAWRWDTVKVRRWDHEGTGRLVLGHGWRRVIVTVPPDRRPAVDALLEEKLPQ